MVIHYAHSILGYKKPKGQFFRVILNCCTHTYYKIQLLFRMPIWN